MKRRRRSTRRNPTPDNTVPIILGSAAVLGGVLFISRRLRAANIERIEQPVVTEPTTTTTTPRPRTPTTHIDPMGPGGSGIRPEISSATAARLASSEPARKLFIFQATLYSWGFSQNMPDGVDGRHTGDDVARINTLAGSTQPASRVFGAYMVERAISALRSHGVVNAGFLLPFKMPAALIATVDETAGGLYPGLRLQVQVLPSGEVSPSGNPYGRAKSVNPDKAMMPVSSSTPSNTPSSSDCAGLIARETELIRRFTDTTWLRARVEDTGHDASSRNGGEAFRSPQGFIINNASSRRISVYRAAGRTFPLYSSPSWREPALEFLIAQLFIEGREMGAQVQSIQAQLARAGCPTQFVGKTDPGGD